MKVAVIKLGARIVFGENIGSSGGSGEAASIINMLERGGAEVHVYTKILNKDVIPTHVSMHQILTEHHGVNEKGFDALLVINGNVNYFGGEDDPAQTMNYWMINNFKGPVFYVYCDPSLPLRQIWPIVVRKPWASNYRESDINITRTDIRVICQIYNTSRCREIFRKNGFEVKSVSQYPLEKFPMMFSAQPSLLPREVDIAYGGTFRSGRREKKLIDFYFGYPPEIAVNVFGRIALKDFNPALIEGLRAPSFSGPVNYDKMIERMSRAVSHVVIGDTKYPEYEMISQRAYESIKAGCVTMIDSDFDRKRRVFGSNKELSELLYVDDRTAVLERLNSIRRDELAIRQIADEQRRAVNFDPDTFCRDFVELIRGEL